MELDANQAIALTSVAVAGVAIIVSPWLASRAQRKQTTLDRRRDAYAEILYLLRHRQEEMYLLSSGGRGVPAGEPEARELKETIARLSLYSSARVWKLSQAFLLTYGTGGGAAFRLAASQDEMAQVKARLEIGKVASELERDVDAITDAMRRDLGLPPFYFKDRPEGDRLS